MTLDCDHVGVCWWKTHIIARAVSVWVFVFTTAACVLNAPMESVFLAASDMQKEFSTDRWAA